MSKSVKMIAGVVASIAIPFAAPALAAMVAGSTAFGGALAAGATALGTTATSGLIGAGLGAASAGLTGGDIGKGAIFGGLGGGLAGYGAAAKAAQAAKTGSALTQGGFNAATAPAGLATDATAGLTAPTSYGAASGVDATAAGLSSGLSGAGAGASTGTSALGNAAASITPEAMAQSAGQGLSSGYTGGTTASTGLGGRISAGLKTSWQNATSPDALGRMATSTAKYLGTSALVGSGLDPQQEALIREQRAEMHRAQQANEQTNAIRTEQGLKLIREADYYDPEYMGLQRARQEQVRGARLRQAGVRGMTGAQASSEGRRFDLGTSRATGAAYDQGYQGGISARTSTRAAGVGLLPTSYPQSDYGGINQTYLNANTERRSRYTDAGKFVGELFTDPKDEDQPRGG